MTGIFDQVLKVQPEHIDRLGHVNNVVYVQWMQDVASAHIEQLGLGLNEYLQLKHAMVAVEHHVQYRKAAFEGDELILRTWLSDLNALYSFRQYAFYRPQDQNVLFTGSTQWACIEIASGRPKRMSPSFTQAYQPLSDSINPYDFSTLYLSEEAKAIREESI
ncbi:MULTISPECIES: thioesterase family protein [Acinetobacter]|uniref:Acyl-CoA thioesterase n=1 Tax=Acinetobacter variabilis TaxID=70346 RepID=A0A7T7WGL5_9GAMM|nr:thioesterase family protein [Acinetobacter variabilis]NHB64981.1 acyl-CoA thioesterase [Acinetobacter sp. GFQ9D191M]NHC01158.1 acyl-CoA thioesterase [Acinetobacter sp. GFQ9D192M]QQN87259.1 acyl-CoA thioesterase [Acinetobacter variabilis]WKT74180.1 thioesterase family protein [Acinetobacter variabilis]